MKKSLLLSGLLSMSISASAGPLVWKSINVLDATQPTGISAYVGTVDADVLKKVASGEDAPDFIEITNLVVIEQTGAIKKFSEFPWGGGKFVTGNDVYVNAESIMTIQSINKNFEKELDAYVK